MMSENSNYTNEPLRDYLLVLSKENSSSIFYFQAENDEDADKFAQSRFKGNIYGRLYSLHYLYSSLLIFRDQKPFLYGPFEKEMVDHYIDMHDRTFISKDFHPVKLNQLKGYVKERYNGVARIDYVDEEKKVEPFRFETRSYRTHSDFYPNQFPRHIKIYGKFNQTKTP